MVHIRKTMLDILFRESQDIFQSAAHKISAPMVHTAGDIQLIASLGLTPIVVEIGEKDTPGAVLEGKILILKLPVRRTLLRNKPVVVSDDLDVFEKIIKICADKIYQDSGLTGEINPDLRIFLVMRSCISKILVPFIECYLEAYKAIKAQKHDKQIRAVSVVKLSDETVNRIIEKVTAKRLESLSSIEFLSYNMEELKYIRDLFQKNKATSLL